MTEPGGDVSPERQGGGASTPSWGTWEELLLAFAVDRYGTAAWDSVANELQRRTSKRGVTAQNCRLKYLDIKRRFDAEETVRLLEQLRKLRVAELRREVQRHDLNIESLELKVKMMEAERERSLRGEISTSDKEKENREKESGPPERVIGEGLEKERLSAHESNSTDDISTEMKSGGDDDSTCRKVADRKLVLEESCNGSTNSRQEPEQPKREPFSGSGEVDFQGGSCDLPEAGTKEDSDVQSSAGKSRKGVGNDKAATRRSSIMAEHEHEGQSSAIKYSSAQSQPLMALLCTLRAHKLSAVFQRRLLSQESSIYEKTVLEHVDFDTVEERMKGGLYSSSPAKFFRDLLLLVNNAIVFYPGDSMEANAAMEIRVMVRKEISQRHSKSDASLVKAASLESHLAPKMEEGELFNLLKPGICRKRSSIKAKASPVVDERREEKPRMPFAMLEEPKITKKRSRERIPTVSSNLKPEDPEVIDNKASLEPRKQRSKGVVSSSADHGGETKVVDVNKAKKRGTAIFLNRMSNSSTPSSNGLLVDAMRNTPLSSGSTLCKRGEKKQQHSTRRSSETREMKAKVAAPSPVKRSVGRPPKRTPPPHPPLVSKEGWETGEPDSTSLSTVQKKKRSRKM